MPPYGLATYHADGGQRAGLVVAGQIIDITSATGRPEFVTVAALLADWPQAQTLLDALATDAKAPRRPRQGTVLAAPVPAPLAIYAIGANYQQHLDNMMRAQNAPMQPNARDAGMPPFFFLKSGHCVVGTGAEVPLSGDKMDWEAELAVVIGIRTRHVSTAQAMASVAGYTVANDLSARDRAIRKNGSPTSPFFFDFVAQKSFDSACPLGPVIVPARFIADPQALPIRLWVNDTLRTDATTAEMIYPIAEQIAFLSSFVTLYPGDLILTGTPAGVGAETATYLQTGDHIRITIDGVGSLENRIIPAVLPSRPSGAAAAATLASRSMTS